MRKYRFKEEYSDAQIVITGSREVITNQNLSDAVAERIKKKFPHLAHNIEEVPEGESWNWEPKEKEPVEQRVAPLVTFAPEAPAPVAKQPRKKNRGGKNQAQ